MSSRVSPRQRGARVALAMLATPALLAALAAAATPLRAQHEGHGAPAHRRGSAPALGTVTFPNSGAAAAQAPFLRGLALLHSFEYDDAADAFRAAQRADPAFALPYWAEALTYSHVLWGEEDLAAARAALARLAATPAARLAKARQPRERLFGAAVEAAYADGPELARARAFADSLRRWAAAMPADHEAHAFAALGALWQGYGTLWQARGAQADSALAVLAEGATHAQHVFDANPQHPGAAHYLIHAWDSPAAAEKGLAAARAYARIAPDAEHALHMPSHIFLQLGLWDDVVASNERAWAASRAWTARHGRPTWDNDWHSLNWLQYGYLQQGRWDAARALVDTARALTARARWNEPGVRRLDGAFAVDQLAFRYATETGRWDAWPADAAPAVDWRDPTLSPRARGMAAFALYQRATAAALGRRDTLPAVATARALRDTSAAATRALGMTAPALARQLDLAVMQVRGGARALGALEALEASAAASRNAPAGPPGMTPTNELLGAALLDASRARDAAAAYARALETRPNRAAALLGLSRARLAAGDTTGARQSYAALLAAWRHADADLPALAEARTWAATSTPTPAPSASGAARP